jgi:hypothetical protein
MAVCVQLELNGICVSNVAYERLVLVRIREVRGSKLCSESGYADRGFSWLSLVSPGKCQASASNRFLQHRSQAHCLLIIRYSMLLNTF